MSAKQLEGKPLADARRDDLVGRASALAARTGTPPCLAVVIGTSDGAALAYFRAKQRLGGKLGVRVLDARVAEAKTESLVDAVRALSADPSVDAIMVETPVAAGVDLRAVQDAIPAEKDVDGASTLSLGRLFSGQPGFVPATAAAVMALLDGHGIELRGAHAVVVGRSLVVGRPLGQLLLARGATVTACHSKTRELEEHVRFADVVCVAVGKPRFLKADWVRPGAVVVDVGTNVVGDALVGDVDFAAVSDVAGWISPVPGGVGPLTTVLLLDNVVRAAETSRP
ncbi:MAG: bifunctional 5,10-methylenetetrahydrofolate dehydrogenase/5,10-methenyltetrahydrofolate cyclohydrolase [Candidatus Bipolaricaulis sp.]|nr:bifunctional 5,10-methylenetetrahydrofolate dehydrogenase/5,10-methenyltetrahydrofolate cyclohydrolase [Candidatus Bipolaricaulis sp.]